MSAARGERPAADRASFDRLTAALDTAGRRYRLRGSDHLDGQCPAHDDGRASLSADFHPAAGDLPGRVMLRCHAGCAAEDVVAVLGLVLADLYDGPAPRRSAPSPRRVSARPAAKPARKPDAKPADHRCRWEPEPVTTYPYCDENGAVIGEVIRQRCTRPGCGAKNFPVRRPALPTDDPARVRDGWVYRWPTQRPLYRLPEVLAAARAGGRVLVVEGEKDAEALAAVGAVATCNPGGADNGSGGKWRPEHTAALAGAAVVIVADRDAAGYRHAEYVRGQLAAAGAARSVRVVEAAAGKDAADHLAAGRGVGELVAIDPAAKLAALSAPAPADDDGQGATVVPGPWRGEPAGGRRGGGSGGSGGSGGGDRVSLRKVRQDFRVIDGELCHVIDDTATVVLDADARVQARLFRDMGDPEGRRGPDGRPVEPEVTHVRLSVTAPDMPDPWVSLPEWDDFRGGGWVRDCPVPLSFEDTAKGRARLWTAVQRVSGRGTPRVPVHGALGWRRGESGRPFYVHAGGVLGAEGAEEGALVAVPELLAEHVLPAPVSDPAGLRECLAASLRALEELPDHVAAPVLGFAYRVPLGWLRPALYPVGPKSSGKTGLGALAMQHFQPGARQSSKWARPGDKHLSVIGTYAALYAGMHAPLMVDDSAPDRRSAPVAEWVSETLRTQYNGNTRAVASRDGSLARRPARARGGLIITGEMPSSTDSANSRAMFVPVSRSDELGPALAELDRDGMPEARLALMASYVAWLARHDVAPDCQRLAPAVQECRDSLRDGLMGELGGDMRLAEATADYLTGWHYLLAFAVEVGALEPGESAGLWRRVRSAMLTAARRQDIAAETDPAARVLGLLREAFMTGAAYLTSEDGDSAPSDALALGWESVTSTGGGLLGGGPSVSYRFRGERIGVRTNHGRVWLLPGPAAAAVNREARDSGDPLDLAPHALAAILDDAGHLRTSTEAGKKQRAPKQAMFGGGRPRVWDLPAAVLLGEDQADDDGPVPVDPAPEPPPADDLPGGPDDPLCEVCGCQILAGAPGQTTHPMCAPADETGGERCADSAGSGAPDQSRRSVTTEGKPPAGPAAAAAPRFEAPAVVVDGSGGWLPDGRRVPLPERLESLADLLGWAEGLRLGLEHEHGMPDDGQVWLMPDAAARLGLPECKPETDTKGHRALAAARAAGWTVAELRSWMWAYRRGGRTLGVAVAGWMPPADHPMLAGASDARRLAARLGLWVARTGLTYRLTAGVTGLDLLDVLPRRVRLEDREAPAPVRPAAISTLEDDYLWQRPPTPEEARLGWVHAYDANAMYLSAAAQVDLGMGAARHVGEPCEFDPSLPGYWRIEPGTWDDRLLPDLLDPMCRGRRWRSQWFTTPTLRRLAALGYAVEPLEAHVWDERARFLLPWSNRLRDARAALMAPELAGDADARAVLAEVKFCYAMGVGMLGKPPAKGRPRPAYYRPHWRHAVIAEARANLARKLHTAAEAGRFPLAIATDCVLYASDSPDPAAALPPGFRMDESGRQLGHVKPAGSARMADVAALLAASLRPDRPGNVFEIVEG